MGDLRILNSGFSCIVPAKRTLEGIDYSEGAVRVSGAALAEVPHSDRKPNPSHLKTNLLRATFSAVLTLMLVSACTHLPTRTASVETSRKTAPERPTHPLDPLTASEFATLKEVLTTKEKFSDKTIYTWVQLREPPKEEVLAFKSGDPFRREAYVALLSPEKKTAYEVIVDLNARTVLSRKDLGNLQPFITDADYGAAFAAIDGSA